MNKLKSYSALITGKNPDIEKLKRSWATAEYSEENGIGPMGSLHEAGDSVIAVAQITDEGIRIIGSGVMIGQGLALTATHVLDEFPTEGTGPLFLTFLPDGARAWLPCGVSSASGPSEFEYGRKKKSDLSLVSCTLNSDAHEYFPLMLAPMQVELPLPGERLWAIGYRHMTINNGAALINPLVSSGMVTEVFPHGRGERMPASCIEVEMETLGGMSGGPVFNSDGYLIGIVSSSFEGGPTYVTLIWDALRLSVKGNLPGIPKEIDVNLFLARDFGVVKMEGDVARSVSGNVVTKFSSEEIKLIVASSDSSKIRLEEPESAKSAILTSDQLEDFSEKWGGEIEDSAELAAIDYLRDLSLPTVQKFLSASNIPQKCLILIHGFDVEDMKTIEDPDIGLAERIADDAIEFEYRFDLQMVIWTVEVQAADYYDNADDFEEHFINIEVNNQVASMQVIQRCHFAAEIIFNPIQEGVEQVDVRWAGVKRRTKRVRRV